MFYILLLDQDIIIYLAAFPRSSHCILAQPHRQQEKVFFYSAISPLSYGTKVQCFNDFGIYFFRPVLVQSRVSTHTVLIIAPKFSAYSRKIKMLLFMLQFDVMFVHHIKFNNENSIKKKKLVSIH